MAISTIPFASQKGIPRSFYNRPTVEFAAGSIRPISFNFRNPTIVERGGREDLPKVKAWFGSFPGNDSDPILFSCFTHGESGTPVVGTLDRIRNEFYEDQNSVVYVSAASLMNLPIGFPKEVISRENGRKYLHYADSGMVNAWAVLFAKTDTLIAFGTVGETANLPKLAAMCFNGVPEGLEYYDKLGSMEQEWRRANTARCRAYPDEYQRLHEDHELTRKHLNI